MALFAQFVERLFGLDDLFARFAFNIDLRGAGRDVLAKRDQFAADRQIIDHLGIVARGKGRDRSPGEAGEIGGAAQFLEALVVLQERLQRHRRGQRVLGDPGGGNFVDAGWTGS